MRFDDPLAPVGALHAGLVGAGRIGVSEERVVVRLGLRPLCLGKDEGKAVPDAGLRGTAVEGAVGGIDGQHDPVGIGEDYRLGGPFPHRPEARLGARLPLRVEALLALIKCDCGCAPPGVQGLLVPCHDDSTLLFLETHAETTASMRGRWSRLSQSARARSSPVAVMDPSRTITVMRTSA